MAQIVRQRKRERDVRNDRGSERLRCRELGEREMRHVLK